MIDNLWMPSFSLLLFQLVKLVYIKMRFPDVLEMESGTSTRSWIGTMPCSRLPCVSWCPCSWYCYTAFRTECTGVGQWCTKKSWRAQKRTSKSCPLQPLRDTTMPPWPTIWCNTYYVGIDKKRWYVYYATKMVPVTLISIDALGSKSL